MKLPVTSRFRTVHIDIVGPLKTTTKGNKWLVTIMDRFSRWLEAIPISDIKAITIARKFYDTWVCRFGVPDYIITDQGSQFESEIFAHLLQSLDIKRKRSTAYHPQSNGMIERVHAVIKQTLRCLGDRFPDWQKALPTALFAIRTTVNAKGISPTLMLYGEQVSIPGVFVNPLITFNEESDDDFVEDLMNHWFQVRDFVLANDPTPGNAQSGTPTSAFPHTHVWIIESLHKRSLYPKARGPYKVLEVNYPVIFIKVDGVKQSVNVDRCKPAFILKRDLLNEELPDPIWVNRDKLTSPITENESVLIKAEALPRTIGTPILPIEDKTVKVRLDRLDEREINRRGQVQLRRREAY